MDLLAFSFTACRRGKPKEPYLTHARYRTRAQVPVPVRVTVPVQTSTSTSYRPVAEANLTGRGCPSGPLSADLTRVCATADHCLPSEGPQGAHLHSRSREQTHVRARDTNMPAWAPVLLSIHLTSRDVSLGSREVPPLPPPPPPPPPPRPVPESRRNLPNSSMELKKRRERERERERERVLLLPNPHPRLSTTSLAMHFASPELR
ncbi:hypothetical protein F4780DRAFT_281712 [Xylariomycetidae sp. FL0641]|nr:hypothetical protein F4780DRAFT_281712 [Xylariomycetidae sp. FL0641]